MTFKIVISVIFIFFAGFFDGVSDRLSFTYGHPFPENSTDKLLGMNRGFWDVNGSPAFAPSWTRKYKDGRPEKGPAFWGSTTFFAFFTDGWHLAKTASMAFLRIAFLIVLSAFFKGPFNNGRIKNTVFFVAMFFIATFVQSIGFNIIF